jgi:hypothetical protein
MPAIMKSVEVRSKLVAALKLDLVGPKDDLGDPKEALPQSPSRWYLTGFLVPLEGGQQRKDETGDDDLDQAGEPAGIDDDATPERPAARQRYLPSSIGISLIVPAAAQHIQAKVSWGDYHRRSETPEEWERTPRSETVALDLSKATNRTSDKAVPNSGGLEVSYLSRPVGLLAADAGVPSDARTVSVFVVKRRRVYGKWTPTRKMTKMSECTGNGHTRKEIVCLRLD